jgi:hypothetical protein
MTAHVAAALRQFRDARDAASKRHATVIALSCAVASMPRKSNAEEPQ